MSDPAESLVIDKADSTNAPTGEPSPQAAVGLDLMTGIERWTAANAGTVRIQAGGLAITSRPPSIVAYDVLDGRIRWTIPDGRPLPTVSDSGPAEDPASPTDPPFFLSIAAASVPRSGGIANVEMLEVNELLSGAVRWQTEPPGNALVAAADPRTVVIEAVTYRPDNLSHANDRPPLSRLVAFDAATGKIRWDVDITTAPYPGAPGDNGLNDTSVAISGGRVFVVAPWTLTVRALDLATGKQLWEGVLPNPHTPFDPFTLSANEKVVIAPQGGRPTAFDAETGRQLWSQPLERATAASIGDPVILVGNDPADRCPPN